MKLSTLFRAYRATESAHAATKEEYLHYWDHHTADDEDSMWTWMRIMERRSRQQRKLAKRITAELAAQEWTPATAPPEQGELLLIAWIDTNGKRIVTGGIFVAGKFYHDGDFTGNPMDWTAYKWKPWPAPPPLRGGE